MKLWGGRFSGDADKFFAEFNASFRFDQRLLQADLKGCEIQARALAKAGVISATDADEILRGLAEINSLSEDPAYLQRPEFGGTEDVHSFIEARLVESIGSAGFRLHTGRSRNDQVATASRLFLRTEIDQLDQRIAALQTALLDFADRYPGAALPGYTHLQKAQPILLAHFLLSYYQMLSRDRQRLKEIRARVNLLPIGSGALAGTNFPVDREWMAAELGFDGVTRNSLDAVSDRDYMIEFTHAAAISMMHLSRLAEDFIIYSTQEFGFIKLGDAIATGSSLMPQKKNPDSLELIRGKAARIFGHSTAMLVMAKGLPMAYNKDLQEDKEALFDTIETWNGSLRVMATVLRNIDFDSERARAAAITDYTNATDLADYLVRGGLEFRKAHEVIGRIVVYALDQGKELMALSLEEYQKFSLSFKADLFDAISLESCLKAKSRTGGTAPAQVEAELKAARKSI